MPMARETALKFIEAINAADVGGIASLMTDDHSFTDAHGSTTTGREAMRDGWAGYFGLFQAYRIDVESMFARGGEVVLLGRASGTGSAGRFDLPAAWRARVRAGKVAAWQVFCDTQLQFKAKGKA